MRRFNIPQFIIYFLFTLFMSLFISIAAKLQSDQTPYNLNYGTDVLHIHQQNLTSVNMNASLIKLAAEEELTLIIYEPYITAITYIYDPAGRFIKNDRDAASIILYDDTAFGKVKINDEVYFAGERRLVTDIFDDNSLLRRWMVGPDFILPLQDAYVDQGSIYIPDIKPEKLEQLIDQFRQNGYIVDHSSVSKQTIVDILSTREMYAMLPSLLVIFLVLFGTAGFYLKREQANILIHRRLGATRLLCLRYYIKRICPLLILATGISALLTYIVIQVLQQAVTTWVWPLSWLLSCMVILLVFTIVFWKSFQYHKEIVKE